jgi:hypothetical protein
MEHLTTDHSAPDVGADETRRIVRHFSDLIRTEYTEMPCLSLTLPQAMRLWSVDKGLCELGLTALVQEGFLECAGDGQYRLARLGSGGNVDRRF